MYSNDFLFSDHGVFKKTDGNVYLHYVEEIEHKVTKDVNIHKSKIGIIKSN